MCSQRKKMTTITPHDEDIYHLIVEIRSLTGRLEGTQRSLFRSQEDRDKAIKENQELKLRLEAWASGQPAAASTIIAALERARKAEEVTAKAVEEVTAKAAGATCVVVNTD